jgi:hypothetical protein
MIKSLLILLFLGAITRGMPITQRKEGDVVPINQA